MCARAKQTTTRKPCQRANIITLLTHSSQFHTTKRKEKSPKDPQMKSSKSPKSTTKWCEDYVRNKLPQSLLPKSDLEIKEIGDGNMNYVYNVSNAIAVKTSRVRYARRSRQQQQHKHPTHTAVRESRTHVLTVRKTNRVRGTISSNAVFD